MRPSLLVLAALVSTSACTARGPATVEPSATCDVGPGVVSLVEGHHAYAIAVDDSSVYVASSDGIWRVAKTGGSASLVSATEQASAIAIDAQRVYWIGLTTGVGSKPSSSTALFAAPLGGGSAVMLSDGAYATRLAVDDERIYGAGAQVWSVTKAGGATSALTQSPLFPNAFALADDDVYVASFCCDLAHGTIARLPKTGGAPTVLVENQAHPLSIAVDATAIYWINAGYGGDAGGLMRAARDGSAVTTLLAEIPSSFRGMSALALDGTNLYWTETATGRVMKMAKAGGSPSTIASGLTAPTELVARGGNVYWTSQPLVDASTGGGGGTATVMTACK